MRSTEERPHSVNILYCYAVVKEDERLKNKLRHQFSILRRQKLINDWCTGDLKPGQNWKEAVERRLETAHLILLLISPDFMVSDYWHGIVMRAIERDGKGEAKVISILLRPTNITDAPFSHLRVLPEGRRPVSLGNVERACAEIVEAISPMIHDILGTSPIDELFEQLGVTDNTPKNRRNVRLAPPASNNGVARNRPSGQTPARPASNGQTRNRSNSRASTQVPGRRQARNRSNGRMTLHDTGDVGSHRVRPLPSTINNSLLWEEIRDLIGNVKFPGLGPTYRKLISKRSLNRRYGKGLPLLGWVLFLILDVFLVSLGIYLWYNHLIVMICTFILLSLLFLLLSYNRHLLLNVAISIFFSVACFKLGSYYIPNVQSNVILSICVCLFFIHVLLFRSTQ